MEEEEKKKFLTRTIKIRKLIENLIIRRNEERLEGRRKNPNKIRNNKLLEFALEALMGAYPGNDWRS